MIKVLVNLKAPPLSKKIILFISLISNNLQKTNILKSIAEHVIFQKRNVELYELYASFILFRSSSQNNISRLFF